MTAKEKAKYLVDSFIELNHDHSLHSNEEYGMSYEYHKKCAKLVTIEILISIPATIGQIGSGSAKFKNPDIDFWNEVKKEIELL